MEIETSNEEEQVTADSYAIERRSGSATVVAEVEIGPGRCVITKVTVSAPDGVTHRMLREISFGEIVADARGLRPLELPPAGTLPKTSGRTIMTDALLRQVALVYIEEATSGKNEAVLERMASRFGRPKQTVRHWVAQARRAGWLAPGMKGRASADPGPRLLADPSGQNVDRLMPEQVERTVELFRAAVATGVRGPGRQVARQLGVSESMVSRRLNAARSAGVLGELP